MSNNSPCALTFFLCSAQALMSNKTVLLLLLWWPTKWDNQYDGMLGLVVKQIYLVGGSLCSDVTWLPCPTCRPMGDIPCWNYGHSSWTMASWAFIDKQAIYWGINARAVHQNNVTVQVPGLEYSLHQFVMWHAPWEWGIGFDKDHAVLLSIPL